MLKSQHLLNCNLLNYSIMRSSANYDYILACICVWGRGGGCACVFMSDLYTYMLNTDDLQQFLFYHQLEEILKRSIDA